MYPKRLMKRWGIMPSTEHFNLLAKNNNRFSFKPGRPPARCAFIRGTLCQTPANQYFSLCMCSLKRYQTPYANQNTRRFRATVVPLSLHGPGQSPRPLKACHLKEFWPTSNATCNGSSSASCLVTKTISANSRL